MDGADIDDDSEAEQTMWEPEMQHVDTDNVELPKSTVSKCSLVTKSSESNMILQ